VNKLETTQRECDKSLKPTWTLDCGLLSTNHKCTICHH